MRQHRRHHRYRRALWGGAILAGSALAALGTGRGLAQRPAGSVAAQAPGRAPARQASAGTVVRLHQRVVRVSIINFTFKPARLVVSPGTRVVWTNRDGDPHTVTSTKGLWASDALDTDNQFARVFRVPGTFPYYCAIHPFMHGTIVIKK